MVNIEIMKIVYDSGAEFAVPIMMYQTVGEKDDNNPNKKDRLGYKTTPSEV